MSLKIPLTSVGGSLLACSAVAYGGSCTPAAAQAADQEKILALCETPNQTIRIYQVNGETRMRAYDRQNNAPESAALWHGYQIWGD